jgi:30S ribosomal protein S31
MNRGQDRPSSKASKTETTETNPLSPKKAPASSRQLPVGVDAVRVLSLPYCTSKHAYCPSPRFPYLCRTKKLSIMGRGDKKTKKGKIFKGSFGKSRPATEKKITGNQPAPTKKSS